MFSRKDSKDKHRDERKRRHSSSSDSESDSNGDDKKRDKKRSSDDKDKRHREPLVISAVVSNVGFLINLEQKSYQWFYNQPAHISLVFIIFFQEQKVLKEIADANFKQADIDVEAQVCSQPDMMLQRTHIIIAVRYYSPIPSPVLMYTQPSSRVGARQGSAAAARPRPAVAAAAQGATGWCRQGTRWNPGLLLWLMCLWCFIYMFVYDGGWGGLLFLLFKPLLFGSNSKVLHVAFVPI